MLSKGAIAGICVGVVVPVLTHYHYLTGHTTGLVNEQQSRRRSTVQPASEHHQKPHKPLPKISTSSSKQKTASGSRLIQQYPLSDVPVSTTPEPHHHHHHHHHHHEPTGTHHHSNPDPSHAQSHDLGGHSHDGGFSGGHSHGGDGGGSSWVGGDGWRIVMGGRGCWRIIFGGRGCWRIIMGGRGCWRIIMGLVGMLEDHHGEAGMSAVEGDGVEGGSDAYYFDQLGCFDVFIKAY
ncbi:hypothetical protein BT96DRAFT_995977 [Gymnopus androsaceus JB14]|uniref:Uncharacterized protein n=1 Tax=Gymnopus androsaceus JB14 TaxID=1447944 RepID=A0A6A4HJH9_9AGAR|nr:hypothetical protein BT96DRAFT_995977 [Gymnopus androsaceus JB14]